MPKCLTRSTFKSRDLFRLTSSQVSVLGLGVCWFKVHHGRTLWQKILIPIIPAKGHNLSVSSMDIAPSDLTSFHLTLPSKGSISSQYDHRLPAQLSAHRPLEDTQDRNYNRSEFSYFQLHYVRVQDSFLWRGWKFNVLNLIVTASIMVIVICFQPLPALMGKGRW